MAQHDSRGLREKIIPVETDYGGLSSADGSIIARMVGPGAGGQRGCLTRGYHGVTTTPWRKAWIEQTRREE